MTKNILIHSMMFLRVKLLQSVTSASLPLCEFHSVKGQFRNRVGIGNEIGIGLRDLESKMLELSYVLSHVVLL